MPTRKRATGTTVQKTAPPDPVLGLLEDAGAATGAAISGTGAGAGTVATVGGGLFGQVAIELTPEPGDSKFTSQLEKSFADFRRTLLSSANGDKTATKAVTQQLKTYAAAVTGTTSDKVNLSRGAANRIRRLLETQARKGVMSLDLGLLGTAGAVNASKLQSQIGNTQIGRATFRKFQERLSKTGNLVAEVGQAVEGPPRGLVSRGARGALGLAAAGSGILANVAGFAVGQKLIDSVGQNPTQAEAIRKINKGEIPSPEEFQSLSKEDQDKVIPALERFQTERSIDQGNILAQLARFDPSILQQVGQGQVSRSGLSPVSSVPGNLALSIPGF